MAPPQGLNLGDMAEGDFTNSGVAPGSKLSAPLPLVRTTVDLAREFQFSPTIHTVIEKLFIVSQMGTYIMLLAESFM